MYKNESAKLRMRKILCQGKEADDNSHDCVVLSFQPAQECTYLVLQEGELTDIMLDGMYSCEIMHGEDRVECTGNIVERYNSQNGKTLKFQIKNGFYKINIK